jgi:hypothetical protein
MRDDDRNENRDLEHDDLGGLAGGRRCSRRDTVKVSIAALGLLVGYLVFGTGCATTRVSESYTFDGSAANLAVDVEAGDVVVTGTDEAVTRVDVELVCQGGTPSHAVRLDAETLRVDARAGWAGRSRCGGRVSIATPRRTSIAANVQRGDVAVSDIDGRIEVETLEGDITYGSTASRVALRSESTDAPSSGPGVHFNQD